MEVQRLCRWMQFWCRKFLFVFLQKIVTSSMKTKSYVYVEKNTDNCKLLLKRMSPVHRKISSIKKIVLYCFLVSTSCLTVTWQVRWSPLSVLQTPDTSAVVSTVRPPNPFFSFISLNWKTIQVSPDSSARPGTVLWPSLPGRKVLRQWQPNKGVSLCLRDLLITWKWGGRTSGLMPAVFWKLSHSWMEIIWKTNCEILMRSNLRGSPESYIWWGDMKLSTVNMVPKANYYYRIWTVACPDIVVGESTH